MASSGQLRRGRTRDYTIPVRLNQLSLPNGTGASMRPQSIKGSNEAGPISIITSYLIVLIVIIASTKVELSHCDNVPSIQSKSATNLKKQADDLAATKQQSETKASAIDLNNAKSIKRNRERFLAKLSENIERQHLKMDSQRPSKFDSGLEDDGKPEVVHTTDRTRSIPSKNSPSASDETLKDIMRLHEQSAVRVRQSSNHNEANLHLVESPVGQSAGNKLPSGSLTASPTKAVSQLLSYIVSPLSKLSASTEIGVPSSISSTANSSFPWPRYSRPLTGGSNSEAQVAESAPLDGAPPSSKPFLMLPNWIKSSRKSTYFGRPSTLFGDRGSPWTMSSTDQTQADSTPSSRQIATGALDASVPVRRPKSSSRQNRGNKEPSSLPMMPGRGSEDQIASKDRGAAALRPPLVARWLKNNANQVAQNYLQDSFRGLLTLSQLPILPVGPVSTAPSVLENRPMQQRRRGSSSSKPQTAAAQLSSTSGSASTSDKKVTINDRRAKAIEDLYRYAYILATSMVGRKRDPLKALSTQTKPTKQAGQFFTKRSIGQLAADNRRQLINLANTLQKALLTFSSSSSSLDTKKHAANPRGVMWDMATDPTLVVTLFHLIERASVALPLGFLLMPIVQMIRNPLNGFNLGRMLPPRALHRSVEHELLAKRLDAVDRVLSRALRPTHRESFMG